MPGFGTDWAPSQSLAEAHPVCRWRPRPFCKQGAAPPKRITGVGNRSKHTKAREGMYKGYERF